MQSDGRVEPPQRHRCFTENAGTAATSTGGDGEIELISSQKNATPMRRPLRQTTAHEKIFFCGTTINVN